MKALVTGATGFIGGNLVRELLGDGAQVRVLARPGSDRTVLEDLNVEVAEGDVTDPASLRPAVEGCDAVFHVAAWYAYWPRDHQRAYRVNVEGTTNVLRVAAEKGVQRVVHTSSVSTVGLETGGSPADENTTLDPRHLAAGYKRSKYEAEQEALRAHRDGLPVVIVNPSAPVGGWDPKPTPTGRVIVDFLKGRMFGYLNTGLNVVHVRDVARGHILALEKGKPGERYILGNRNMSLQEIFETLGRIAGRRPPRLQVPYWAALGFAHMDEAIEGRLLRRTPRATVTEVRLAKRKMYFSAEKAVRELGLPQTPVEEAFADAVGWFRQHGYA
jgi:dihydroflavonol-4-reductase